MSRKQKETEIWFRFKFEDTPLNRMRVQQAADKLFRFPAVIERRQYTTEEVIGMVKAAIEQAALMPGRQQAQAPAPVQSADAPDDAEDVIP